MKITIDPEFTEQIIYGWGTSSCWWSQNVSDENVRKDLAKQLYSKEGLGLNIYRYNVGAGYDENNNRVDNPWRLTESFLVKDEETGEWVYDFTRDKNAVDMMKECLSYGCIDTVILFANSPHYSFTVSGQSSGGFEPDQSNLKKECYQDYVDYFLDITEHFLHDGIPVKFISPINEPQWAWGGESVRQEGCHYEKEEVIELLNLFAKGIKERGLDVKLYAPESGDISTYTQILFDRITVDSDIRDALGALCYHTYWADRLVKLKEQFGNSCFPNPDFRMDMSEWCELPCEHGTQTIESALIMARVIGNDMAFSHANAWTSWVAVNQIGINPDDGLDHSDGLFSASNDFSEYSISKRYYALAHYSKFIPVGSYEIKKCENNISTLNLEEDWNKPAYDPAHWVGTYEITQSAYITPDGKIVLVLVNEGEDRDIKLDVRAKNMTVYTTDETRNLEQTYQGKKQSSITVSHNSIVTIVFE